MTGYKCENHAFPEDMSAQMKRGNLPNNTINLHFSVEPTARHHSWPAVRNFLSGVKVIKHDDMILLTCMWKQASKHCIRVKGKANVELWIG